MTMWSANNYDKQASRRGKEREWREKEANGSSSKNNINRNHGTPAADIYILYIYTILRGAKRAKKSATLELCCSCKKQQTVAEAVSEGQAKGQWQAGGGGGKRRGTLSQQTVPHLHCLPPSGSYKTIMKDNQLCLIVVATAAAVVAVAAAAAVAVEVCRVIDDGCGRAWVDSNLATEAAKRQGKATKTTTAKCISYWPKRNKSIESNWLEKDKWTRQT